tara:strand:+ start:514 stop:1278 length:765 start_codon:yes stop_codon:yes gene_type:complete
MDFRIKTITYLALFFITSSITAQNNLVFNKVLTIKLISGQTAEVPEGKTWKIESTSIGTGTTGAPSIFYLNKDIVDYGDPLTQPQEKWNVDYGGSSNIWLQEGTILRGTGNATQGIKFSIIEFNIEPISSSSGTNTGSSGVSSDGLVFNRVVNTTLTGNFFGGTSAALRLAGSIIIPSGKIWKVHNVDSYYLWSSGTNELIDRPNVFISILIGDNLIQSSSGVTFLSEGTYKVKIKTDGNPINKVVVQAIEYNQ